MQNVLGRRQWIAAAGASVVVAFDPRSRTWLSAASAHESAVPVPELDGELRLDELARGRAADDFGHIVQHRPWAVLLPGSIRDVQRMVCFVNERGLTICMRGQGHSTQGQAQAEGGVVIDSFRLNAIDSVGPEGAVVGPGVRWLDLLEASLPLGLAPPVLTDFIELSVGGTLCVGGIGGATHRHGLQVDNVLELQVVTGQGELVRCSRRHRGALFESVLGGLGQFAIIVQATLKLSPAAPAARVYRLFYTDFEQFTRDQRLAIDGRFDYLEGQVLPQADGSYQFMLEAAKYHAPPALPEDADLLAGFSPIDTLTLIEEPSYFDWQNRLAPLIEQLRAGGQLALPHPWLNLFLPAHSADAFIQGVLSELRPEDTGGGPILCYPIHRGALERPFVAVPDADVVFLFALLRTAPVDPAAVQVLLDRNRALFERARAAGGKVYPIGSLPFSFADWMAHHGSSFPAVAARKARFDPNGVLTPGQGMFPRR